MKPTHGSQLALFVNYSYHGCITDREGDTLDLEADHRRHAEIENAIRDLKYGVGLNHLPSGCFPANAAWLAVQVMAHNLARWTTRIGLGEQLATTKTLRRRFFSLAGRLTRSARRLTPLDLVAGDRRTTVAVRRPPVHGDRVAAEPIDAGQTGDVRHDRLGLVGEGSLHDADAVCGGRRPVCEQVLDPVPVP